MNNAWTHIKLFALYVSIVCIMHNNLISMKRKPEDFLSNNTLITEEIKKYQHYFSAENKRSLIGHFITGDKLLDAGFLQAYVASSINQTISPVEQATYLLHKTFKYALYTCSIINLLKKRTKYSDTISMGLHKIYNHLEWFKKMKMLLNIRHILCVTYPFHLLL